VAARADVYDAVIAAPFGRVGIRTHGDRLVDIDFVSTRVSTRSPRTALAQRVCRELRAYFANPRHAMRLPIRLEGTGHQRRVWRALARIPAGEVRSYGEIAKGLRSSARAVGGACRSNPIPIVVPCHRVIGKRGLGGFMGEQSGSALGIKRWLLTHEQRP
jgi:methylated-DNA-[protein]-cysteine S-methyltransferase